MNCKNCGEKLSAFSAYCEKCGQKAFSTKEWLAYYGKLVLSFLKKRLWLSISVAVAIVLVIVGGIILNTSKQLDPMDYVVINTSGYNGAGKIDLEIDYTTLADKILGPVPDKNSAKGYEEYVEYIDRLERFENSLFVSADKYRGFSNGDFFIITVKVRDKKLFEECGFKLKKSEYSKTVKIGEICSTFEEPTEFDLFNYIDVMFQGENGSGYTIISDEKTYASVVLGDEGRSDVEIKCYESWYSGGYTCSLYFKKTGSSESITLSIDKQSNVSNGDTVTISISDSDLKKLIECGVLITPSNKTYQVTGLS